MEHFYDANCRRGASAVLAASLFTSRKWKTKQKDYPTTGALCCGGMGMAFEDIYKMLNSMKKA